MAEIGGAGMKPLFEPFKPEMTPDQYKKIMKKIEECEGRVSE